MPVKRRVSKKSIVSQRSRKQLRKTKTKGKSRRGVSLRSRKMRVTRRRKATRGRKMRGGFVAQYAAPIISTVGSTAATATALVTDVVNPPSTMPIGADTTQAPQITDALTPTVTAADIPTQPLADLSVPVEAPVAM